MSRRARAGLTVKLAWRQLLRTKGSSLLVAALIAVPVAGAAGVLTFVESRIPSPEQAVTLELGHMKSWIGIAGGADPTRRQPVDRPRDAQVDTDDAGMPVNPELPPPVGLADAALPTGTEAIPIYAGFERLKTRTGIAGFPVIYGEAWDARLDGRYQVLSGRAPQNADEAMASPALLERLGAQVGDEVALTDLDRSARIVGVMRAMDGSYAAPLFQPLSAAPQDTAPTMWFLPDWQPDMEALSALNQAGYVSYARDLVLDPPPGSMFTDPTERDSDWLRVVVILIGLVFGGALVGLLAAAAMAVSTRRQQRSLAVLTTIGTRRPDVFRLVLTQGALLGMSGGLLGCAVGIGGVALTFALLDPGVKGLFWSWWGLKVPWTVGAAVLFALLIGLAASALPARAATRRDALAALRNARRPVQMSRRQPAWGIVITLVGSAGVLAGGTIFSILAAQEFWNESLQYTALWASVIGVLLLLLGMLFTGQGILAGVSRLLSRLGSAARLASRDTVANAPRTVPALVSIAASAAVAAFVLGTIALTSAQASRNYAWRAPAGSVIVNGWSDAAAPSAPEFLSEAQPERIVPIAQPVEPTGGEGAASPEADAGVAYPAAWFDDEGGWVSSPIAAIAVVAPDDVHALTGMPLDDAQRANYAEGGAIVLQPDLATVPARSRASLAHDGIVKLDFWDPATLMSDAPDEWEVLHSVDLTAIVHTGRNSSYPVLLAPSTAERLGIRTTTNTWIGIYSEMPSEAVIDRLNAEAETASSPGVRYEVNLERGPDSPLPWLALVLAALVVIVISAAAISLSLSRLERQEDDATLAAVGATTRVRRWVSAWQAVIIVGVGCVVGVAIGVVGDWVLVQAIPGMQLLDLPHLWLLGIALGLPLVIALVSLLVRPPHPDLTHRTAIA